MCTLALPVFFEYYNEQEFGTPIKKDNRRIEELFSRIYMKDKKRKEAERRRASIPKSLSSTMVIELVIAASFMLDWSECANWMLLKRKQ